MIDGQIDDGAVPSGQRVRVTGICGIELTARDQRYASPGRVFVIDTPGTGRRLFQTQESVPDYKQVAARAA